MHRLPCSGNWSAGSRPICLFRGNGGHILKFDITQPDSWRSWHGCLKCYTRPKTNRQFWDRKREDNMARDKRVNRQLRHEGWKAIRIWQHWLKKSPDACLNRIHRALAT